MPMNNSPKKILREGLEERINKRVVKLKTRRGYFYAITHLGYPDQTKQLNKYEIIKAVKSIESNLPSIKTLLKKVKQFVPNVWDQTPIAAAYLLLGKAIGNLESTIILAKLGYSFEIVEICRSATESLDLAFLFLSDESNFHLKKWLKGKTIKNSIARKAFDDELNSNVNSSTRIPLKNLKADIYDISSLYTHSCYPALLDAIDVFHEDFDYNRISGHHYTQKNLHLIYDLAESILLELKNTFIKFKDLANTNKTENLLNKMGVKKASQSEIRAIIDKYQN